MKHLTFSLFFLLVTFALRGQAVAWELSAATGDQASSPATILGANFSNCNLTRGNGVSPVTGAGSMNASGWFSGTTSTTLADAIAGNDYYEFTINSINCLFFNPTTIQIVLRSSATGPSTATLRCSSDGFTSNIGTVTVGTTSAEFTFSETISPNSQSVTYRLYGYGDAAGGGTPSSGGTMRIGTSVVATDNDLEVFATTTFVTVSQVANITVADGASVPITMFAANVPGATINWSRTPESIGLAPTSGMGNVPAFTAQNNTNAPVTSTFTVNATVGNCTGPDMVFTITVNDPECTITVAFFGNPSACNDNGTPNDPTDDFYTQNINANFFNRPSTGSLQIVPGGDQIGTYSIPVNQIIGNTHTFNGVMLKADGTPTNIQMNFTDEPTCIDAATGPTVQPCSTPPPPCTITVQFFGNPSACNDNGTPNDPTDDFYTQNINANFFNRPSTGSLQIVPGGDQIGTYSIPVNQIIGNTHTFNGVMLKADGTPTNVQMNFTDEPTCIDAATGPTVQPCSSTAPCEVIGMVFNNIGTCNNNGTPGSSGDDFFTADVEVLYSNPPATGNLVLNGAGVATPLSVPVSSISGNSHTFLSAHLVANGNANLITASFSAIPTCTTNATTPAVNSCSTGGGVCDITAVTMLNITSCEDNGTNDPSDDFYQADVKIDFINPPPTGNLQIEPGGDAIGTYSIPVGNIMGSTHTFTNVHFKADGMLTVVEAEFTEPANQCVQSIAGPTVAPCSPICDITSVVFINVVSCDDNNTIDPTDDFYMADIVVNFVNAPESGNLQIEPGGDAIGSYTVPVGNLMGNSYTFVNVKLKADGTITVVEVEFTIPANLCVQTQVGPTVDPCSFLPPTITCPPAVTVSCANQVPPPNIAGVMETHDCPGSVSITHVGDAISNQSCTNRYTITRTYQVLDQCDQTATCTQTITVNDQTPPALTCPVAVTVQCASQVPPVSTGSVTATDNCGGMATITHVSDVTVNQTCVNRYTINRTYRAIDVCGNSATCVQVINVFDNTAPSLTCPAAVTVQCASQVPAANIAGVTSTDNCGGATTVTHVSDVTVNQTCVNRYTLNRTYRSTDLCGNSATCIQTITVFDNTVPTLTCPPAVTVQCAVLVPTPNPAGVITTDNCGGVPVVTFVSDVTINQTCLNRYTINRMYRSTDACGNSATCIQVITVFDNTSPVITFSHPLLIGVPIGGTIEVQCYGQDPEWEPPVFGPTSVSTTDNCTGPVSVAFDETLVDEGNCPVDGYINRYRLRWIATDACGNSSSAHVFVNLVDHIPPVIQNVPADITVNCDEIPEAPMLTAVDECLCLCVVTLAQDGPDPGCQNGQVITRTWTTMDYCGNVAIEQQLITLVDAEGPELIIVQPEIAGLPDGTILNYTCNEGGIPAFYDELSAESVFSPFSCGNNATISFTQNVRVTGNCKFFGYLEQRILRWQGVDACGNQTDLTLTVRLIDTEPPVILNVPEMTCEGDPLLKEVEAIDNCEQVFFHYWDVKIPNPCGTGLAVRRTYEAYDPCFNMTRDTVILLPDDHTPPVMTYVNPVLASLEPGEQLLFDCAAQDGQFSSFGVDDVSASDDCAAGVSISFTERTLEINDCAGGTIAAIELEWIAVDICGNMSSLSVQALVKDTTSPVLVDFAPELTIGCNDPLPDITAQDNCGDVLLAVEQSIIPGSCANEYDVLRTIVATDLCGNATTETQTIHVGDGNGPIIEGVIAELCDDLSIPNVTAYDACAGQFVDVAMTEETLNTSCRDGSVIVRTWSAVDACGHVSQIKQQIVVGDHTAPEIYVPTNSIIRRFLDNPYNFVWLSQESNVSKLNELDAFSIYVQDDCDQEIISDFTLEVTYAENCDEAGYFERRVYTWIATDVCGNSSSISFSVDILDDIPPVLLGIPDDVTIICAQLPSAPNVQSNDPAQPVGIVYTETIVPGNGLGVFEVTRTWVGTDACGNTTSAQQHIHWIPDTFLECEVTVPPFVECNSHGVLITSLVTGGLGEFTYEWEVDGTGFIQSGQGTDQIQIYVGWGEVEINLTITDAYGCSTTCSIPLDCIDIGFNPMIGTPLTANPQAQLQPGVIITPSLPGSNQEPGLEEINVWPNPTNGYLNFSCQSNTDQRIQWSIFNLVGQVVMAEEMLVETGFHTRKVDVSQIPEGSYILQVKSQGEMFSKGIVILHNE